MIYLTTVVLARFEPATSGQKACALTPRPAQTISVQSNLPLSKTLLYVTLREDVHVTPSGFTTIDINTNFVSYL